MSDRKFEPESLKPSSGKLLSSPPEVSLWGRLKQLVLGCQGSQPVDQATAPTPASQSNEATAASGDVARVDECKADEQAGEVGNNHQPDNLAEALGATELDASRELLDRALASLRADHLQLVRWRMFQFVTVREVAKRLKCSESVARQKCEAAVVAFRNAYQIETAKDQSIDGQKSN